MNSSTTLDKYILKLYLTRKSNLECICSAHFYKKQKERITLIFKLKSICSLLLPKSFDVDSIYECPSDVRHCGCNILVQPTREEVII